MRLWTPERVPLTVPLAGLGERALAYGVALFTLLVVAVAGFFCYNFWGDLEADLVSLGFLGLMLLTAVVLALLLGYDVIFEVLLHGQTPGKRLLRLRVVRLDGSAPDFPTALARNLLRIVDFLPFFYGVGTVLLFLSGTRRLGDLFARTVVLSERARHVDLLEVCQRLAGPLPSATMPPPSWSQAEVVQVVSWLERSLELPEGVAERLGKRLLDGLVQRRGEEREPEALLSSSRTALAVGCMRLAAHRRGVMGAMVRMSEATTRLTSAILAFRTQTDLEHADRLDAALREAGAALMKGTQLGAPQASREALSLVLLDAERCRRPSVRKRTVWSSLQRGAPRAIYRERAQVLRAALVLGGATVLGFLLCSIDGELGRALVGDDLSRAIGEGARWTNRIEEDGAFARAAALIILNNSWVCAVAFLSGLLGGVPPLLVLFANGMHLGSVFGYAFHLDSAGTLGRFVLAHGPVELSAICVAAAAGLCLGRALLAPGTRTRLDALAHEAATGGQMLLGTLFAILVIGSVEAFVSPGALLPWALNLLLGVTLWGLFVGWIIVYGRPTSEVTTASEGQ
ncbi:MAG: stage II sporulation protein M [Myxococcota bacterium]